MANIVDAYTDRLFPSSSSVHRSSIPIITPYIVMVCSSDRLRFRRYRDFALLGGGGGESRRKHPPKNGVELTVFSHIGQGANTISRVSCLFYHNQINRPLSQKPPFIQNRVLRFVSCQGSASIAPLFVGRTVFPFPAPRAPNGASTRSGSFAGSASPSDDEGTGDAKSSDKDEEQHQRVFYAFLYKIAEKVGNMRPGDTLLVPGGWRTSKSEQHCIVLILWMNSEEEFTLAVVNTGIGLRQYHFEFVAGETMSRAGQLEYGNSGIILHRVCL